MATPPPPPGSGGIPGSGMPDWLRRSTEESLELQRTQTDILRDLYRQQNNGRTPRGFVGESDGYRTSAAYLNSFNRTLASGQGAVGRWSESLLNTEAGGAMGKFLKAVGLGAYAIETLADRAVQTSNALFQLYDVGIPASLDELQESANRFGIRIDELTKIVTRHSAVVATVGITRMAGMNEQLRQFSENGTLFGMSLEQAQDSLLDYSEILARSGTLQRMGDDQVIEGFRKFADGLNAASQATGRNRDEIMKEIKQRNQQADSLALFFTLSKSQQEQMRATQLELSRFGKGGAQLYEAALQYTRTGSMAQVDPNLRIALQRSGSEPLFQRAMQTTGAEQRALFEQIGRNMEAMLQRGGEAAFLGVEGMKGATEFAGQFASDAQMASGAVRSIAESGKTTGEAGQALVDKTAAGILDAQQRYNTAIATMDNAFSTLATKVTERFIPAFDTAIDKIQEMADKFAGIGDKISQITGEEAMTVLVGLTAAGGTAAALSAARRLAAATPTEPGLGTAAGEPPTPGTGAGRVAANRIPVLQSLLGGELLRILGSVAAAQGQERLGAGLGAAGTTTQDVALGAMLGRLFGPRGELLGAAAGGIYGLYESQDDINRAISNLFQTQNEAATAQQTRDADRDSSSSAITQMSTTATTALETHQTMVEQMNVVIEELNTLITAVNDQTRTLSTAYSRAAGIVTP